MPGGHTGPRTHTFLLSTNDFTVIRHLPMKSFEQRTRLFGREFLSVTRSEWLLVLLGRAPPPTNTEYPRKHLTLQTPDRR